MKKPLAMIIAMLLAACTDESGARRALKDAGLEPQRVGGYVWWGCDGQSDQFRTGFAAINAKGRHVHGVVCRDG